jgi:hypothetical protein
MVKLQEAGENLKVRIFMLYTRHDLRKINDDVTDRACIKLGREAKCIKRKGSLKRRVSRRPRRR